MIFFDRIIKILKIILPYNYFAIVLKRLDFENQNFYTLVKKPLMKMKIIFFSLRNLCGLAPLREIFVQKK